MTVIRATAVADSRPGEKKPARGRLLYSGLSLETLIVIPVKTGINLFQRLTGFPLARERRKAKVLVLLLTNIHLWSES